MEKIRMAVLSRWHPHANGYAKHFSANPDTEVTVIWDEIPERGQKWAEEIGCDFEADYDKVLARDDVDAICMSGPTNLHKEMFLKAAAAGKHIFTEKVLTLTKKDALEVKAAVEKAGVKLVISFPHATGAPFRFAQKLIEDGTLGKLNYMRVRNAHSGISGNWLPDHFKDPVTCGGGAMMDLGAHPMYICSMLMGKPKKISSTFNKMYDTPIDDNCVSVIEFENKVIAVSETGFVTGASPFSFELSGADGTFIYGGPDGKSWLKSSKIGGSVDGWICPNLPKDTIPSAEAQFISAVKDGGEIVFGIDLAVALSELMEGAYKSYHENRIVEFAELG